LKRLAILLGLLSLYHLQMKAQELQAKVNVVTAKINNTDTKKFLLTLQGALTTFLNNRKWTNDVFSTEEKIQCNFIITIDNDAVNGQTNLYKAKLGIQAARPVYNSTYNSPLINFNDDEFVFKYVEYQPIEFNENRVQGNDPLVANLTAVLSYYVYTIIGLDYSSFSARGGDAYFQKAWNIVTNAPDNANIKGWKSYDGLISRYWLIENLINTRYSGIHDALYFYFKSGLDKLYESETDARAEVFNAINALYALNKNFPNLMFIQFFFQGRNAEVANLFKKATNDEKARVVELLVNLDVSNANYYRQEIK
jgi:hypothetical protein